MHALDLDGHMVQKSALSTLAESPSGVSSETTSSGSDGGSVTQGLIVAPRANSLKRSPLGRSVVTALEAELDQVCKLAEHKSHDDLLIISPSAVSCKTAQRQHTLDILSILTTSMLDASELELGKCVICSIAVCHG